LINHTCRRMIHHDVFLHTWSRLTGIFITPITLEEDR